MAAHILILESIQGTLAIAIVIYIGPHIYMAVVIMHYTVMYRFETYDVWSRPCTRQVAGHMSVPLNVCTSYTAWTRSSENSTVLQTLHQ